METHWTMMNQQRMNGGNYNDFRNSPYTLQGDPGSRMIGPNSPSMPPPLPPRRPVSNSYGSYGLFGSNYGGYGGFGHNWNYRGYGGYGSYSPYGSSYYNSSLGGPSGDVENRLVQFAEESTRPAFQSIETMIHTFSSVTMMLESTFFAMTSSFRAILSVADNLSRLRTLFGQIISTFTLFNFLKWLYYKTMFLLGIRHQDQSNETVWRQTLSEVLHGNKDSPTTVWPILTFLGLLFATPYLVHKLIKNASKNAINVNDPKEWFKCSEPVYSAVALYDFNAASKEELNLKTGQKILIAPRQLQPTNLPGWWRASNTVDIGLIPSSYVKVVSSFKKKDDVNETKDKYQASQNNNDVMKSTDQEDKHLSKQSFDMHNLENIYEDNVEEQTNEKT